MFRVNLKESFTLFTLARISVSFLIGSIVCLSHLFNSPQHFIDIPPSFSSELIVCTPVNVGTRYGLDRTKTGMVMADKNAIGIPNGTETTIKSDGGGLNIELSVSVVQSDTIWFGIAAKDNNPADYEVSISVDGINYIDTLTMSVTGNTVQEDYYVVTNVGGAAYIRFEKNGNINNKDV